ncbi:MAG: T9SS type A sorting domain-containing protein [Bacteroidales bacterium]|nr:T9SS type A sorting domain-containing protein [Bacteroidales bacterium]
MKKIVFTALSILLISVVTLAQFRIDVPEIVGPDNEDTDQMPNVILDWKAVVNATGYHVLVSFDESFTNLVVDEITPLSGYGNIDLMFNQTYFWKVRAIQGTEYSEWSEIRSFTTFTALVLDKPGNGASGEEALIEFKWKNKIGGNNLTGINFYQLQVDTSSATFNNVNANSIWNIFIAEGVFVYDLNYVYYGETMYWRMRAMHNNDTCDWSEVRSFTTDNEITLDKPNNGTINFGLAGDIEWDAFEGTFEYDYQVHNNASFNGALNYFVDSTEVPTPQLRYGTTYYWHVRGKNFKDTTAWSEVWNFTTAGMVSLELPLNMADSVSVNPFLKWEQITGTNAYQLQYSEDSTFALTQNFFKATNDNETAPGFNIGTALASGTKYFWRVRACALTDTSDYSEVWSFTTLGVIGINEYFKDDNISIFPNPASGATNLLITVDKPGIAHYSLTDLTGQEIETGLITLTRGENTHRLELEALSKGIYLINLENGDQTLTRKLIIK